jgi:nickel-dependent lactate racemase
MHISVPWKAWFGDEPFELSLPGTWQVDQFRMKSEPLPSEEIHSRISNPLRSSGLREAARGKKRVAIAVDDIARPTPVHEFLPLIIDELAAAGVPEENVSVFIAAGAHRTPVRGDVAKKIGESLAARLKIVYHNPYDNLTDLGHTSKGIPITINTTFLESDFRISIGGITPHDFAGFGGGYKTVTVGLSGIEALHETHIKRIAEFNAGVGHLEGNHFQSYIREIGQRVGIDFSVNVVMTARRGIADIYAGDPDTVFSAACKSARRQYATPTEGGYDLAILNAYPKDLDVTQSMMALNVSFYGNESIVREGGTIVVTTPAIDGAVLHYMGGEDMAGYVAPTSEMMKGRRLVVFSPGLNKHDIQVYYPPGTGSYQTWDATKEHLVELHGNACRACVVECATMQLLRPNA